RIAADRAALAEPVLDRGHDRLGLGGAPVRHEPARALRQPQAHEQDDEAEERADEEGDPPAEVRAKMRGIEKYDGPGRADRRADPEAAVDDEVGPAANARRDQFLDGRVDGRVLATDAGTGQEPEQAVAPDAPRECGRGGRHEIEGERDEEQLLAPEP